MSYTRRRVGRGGRVILDRAPPCKRLKPGDIDSAEENLSGFVQPELTSDLSFVDWDPYRWSRHDESREVACIMAAGNKINGDESRQQKVTTPNSPWRRQRFGSGSMKTINMNKVGAHNAASALINNQFIGKI
jgi:hypothetical protein